MLDNLLNVLIRGRLTPVLTPDQQRGQRLYGTQGGALLTQNDLPALVEAVNAGEVWRVMEASAVASVATNPTTGAGLSLYNGEPDAGKSYVVLGLMFEQDAAPAALAHYHLVHCIHVLKPTTLPTADLTAIRGWRARQGAYKGEAIVDIGATVSDDGWMPATPSVNTATNSETATAIFFPSPVPVVLPPGGLYSIQCLSSDVGVTGRRGFVWAERQLPLV
jgi:hypothetical protein